MSRYEPGPSGEVQKLQSEITAEVNTDAQHLATAVFGKPGAMPDMQRVSDQELTARYRTAYLQEDRQWLTQESQRDPEQFIKTVRQLGVALPEELAPDVPLMPPAPTDSLPPAAVAAPPVVASPPLPPAALTPPGPSLGAIAQPGQPVPYTVPPSM